MKRITVAAFAWLYCSSAFALTGAELQQLPSDKAALYVLGVTDAMFGLRNDQLSAQLEHQERCLVDAGVTNDALLDAVVKQMDDEPASSEWPAFFVVLSTIEAICGTPP